MAQPDLIPMPFAENATPGTIEPIEATTPTVPQDATWSTGFPQVTMQPLAAGGIPPRGQNFNGVLNALSRHIFHMQGGGQYKWDDAHGPYSIGDVLQSDDGLRAYVSIVNNNTDNFNTNPSAIGTSWLPWGGDAKANSNLSIQAGAGLTGGGTLTQNRTLAVQFGTTAGTVMEGNDSRIAGALQKSANLSDLTNVATARSNLGLGTAATRNVGTNTGNVMQVGAFGLGGPNLETISSSDLNGKGLRSVRISPDDPLSPVTSGGNAIHASHSSNFGSGIVFDNLETAGAYIYSVRQGVVYGPREIYHTGNLSPVETSRSINTGTGLTGGGNLSANRTLSIANSHIPIGVGQTWQDVTSNRSEDTTYTNTTGRPIVLSIYSENTEHQGRISIYIDNNLTIMNGGDWDSGKGTGGVTAIVPSGSTYRVVAQPSVSKWSELR